VVRWQLAPGLIAAVLTPQSIAIRTSAGIGLASICTGGATLPRIVTREVSPRLGRRVPAQCLELQLDAALEALTIIVPARVDGSLVTFEADDGGGIRWSDAAGRHRVSVVAFGQVAPLPAGVADRVDLVWQAEVVARDDVSALLAAMPTFTPAVPRGEPVVTDEPRQSGRMIALANRAAGWTQLELEQPRRG